MKIKIALLSLLLLGGAALWIPKGPALPPGPIHAQISQPSSGGGAPSGAAGGDLGSTYPNPTVVSVANVTTGVLPVANGGTANVTSLGGFYPAITDYPTTAAAPSLAVSGSTANKIEAFVFLLKHTQTVGHISLRSNTSLGAGALWSVGVYNAAGTLVFYTGALDGTVTTLQTVTAKNAAGTPGSFVLTPGVYYLAITATVIGAGNTEGVALAPSSAVVNQFINNANGNRQVISATNTVNAVLPSAIGTLSADAGNRAIVLTWMEP